jgi:hypothetical protein
VEKKPLSITILIGNWVSVSMLFLAGELIFRTGALAGLIITASLFTAFLFITPLLKSTVHFQENYSIIKKGSLFIWHLEAVIMNLLISILILHQVFNINFYTVVFINYIMMVVLVFICRKWNLLSKGVLVSNLSLLFVIAIFLPIYIYLQEGLETVYHNLLYYHPRVLHLEQKQYIRYFFVSFFIFIGKLYIQIPILQRFAGPNFGKGLRKLLVAVLIFATLFLAFSTMTFVAITQDFPSKNTNEILLYLIQKKSSPFIFLLIAIALYLLSLLSVVNIHVKLSYQTRKGALRQNSMFTLVFFLFVNILAALFFIQNVSFITIYTFSGMGISFVAFIYFFVNKLKVIIFKKV